MFQGGPAVLLVDDDQMVRPTRRSALQLQVEAVFQGRAAAVEVEPVRRFYPFTNIKIRTTPAAASSIQEISVTLKPIFTALVFFFGLSTPLTTAAAESSSAVFVAESIIGTR